MATILLSAAGAAIGAGAGGTVLGLSGAVIGRAIGATIGRVIDQRALSGGSSAVEHGKVERFRLTGAGEGSTIPLLWGRMRVGGQIIWASRFKEVATTTSSGGGKGGGPSNTTTNFSYTVSIAQALCEGEALAIGRIWADGTEIDPGSLTIRFYPGSQTQLPDPRISAIEGADRAPAYRGTAYVVIEDMNLTAFGNRVPQLNFEVIRPANLPATASHLLPHPDLARSLPGVCMFPGTGEYALATTPVNYSFGPGQMRSANVHMIGDRTDFTRSLEHLRDEVPGAAGVSLITTWFGDDLRCGMCSIRPKVEQAAVDGVEMPWRVSGLTRSSAQVLPTLDGGPVYGGTPADAAVIQAITALHAEGRVITFYPFMLMQQLAGNALPDPYGGAEQAVLPWRGRITGSLAPGQPGTPDRTAAIDAQIAAFFGTATAGHFGQSGQDVTYSGPAEWGYRRFILHHAKLAQIAGGVDAFLIGSEMVGLTTLRGAGDSFPAVVALQSLAAEVRAILGPSVKISYAADWSEYSGLSANGNRYFHLDPLWADANINFIGIDNYMPLTDWRDQPGEADAGLGGPYDPAYLRAGIAGGEGFDWYYEDQTGRDGQYRRPITDGDYAEPWTWRVKDLRGFWENPHHDRIAGVKLPTASPWLPLSKPFRFTEYGCAAIDKGANQPNRFLDPKSSESGLPHYSNGARDDLAQLTYFRAMADHWTNPANNPVSALYAGPMVDFANSHAWAWDSRPFPAFPANSGLWSDAGSYLKGHWLNGRVSNQTAEAIVTEVATRAGLDLPEARRAHGIIRGHTAPGGADGRAILQPVLAAHGIDVAEVDGRLTFWRRDGSIARLVDEGDAVIGSDDQSSLERLRITDAELPGQIRLSYYESEADFEARATSARAPGRDIDNLMGEDLPLLLTEPEAQSIAERWLAEAAMGRETLSLGLPLSHLGITPGTVFSLGGQPYRADRVEMGGQLQIEAVAIDPRPYRRLLGDQILRNRAPILAPVPVYPVFLDLPLLTGAEVPHAPHIAVAASPWPGDVAVWSSPSEDGFVLNRTLDLPAVIGLTETAMNVARSDLWDRGPALRVKISSGILSSATEAAVFSGANAMAIGDGTPGNWEVFQFVTATLVAPNTYDLSLRLRGQAGTDGVMPPVWPIGSTVVLLNSALRQIDLVASARGSLRHFRVVPANRSYDAPSAVALSHAFDGIGLRPYRVAHLRTSEQSNGDLDITWTRRSRIDGDSWVSIEVPLGEESESYRLRIYQGPSLRREATLGTPTFTYTTAMQTSDGVTGAIRVEVAQISNQWGLGPMRQLQTSL